MNLSTRLGKSLGFRLSHLGERLGLHVLVYNPWIMMEFHRHALREAPLVIPVVCELYPNVRSVLDVGSGTGVFASEFARRGLQSTAIENSKHGRRMAAKQGVVCLPFDLRKNPPTPINGQFDLVYCFEIAEHMPAELGDSLIDFLTSLCTRVVFTAAHPGQGGVGHINEQPREYWIKRFMDRGFVLQREESERLRAGFKEAGCAFWFVENGLVFTPRVRERVSR